MKKVISERKGFIEGFDVEKGMLNLHILTYIGPLDTGEFCEEVFRIPYTGDMATANKLLHENCERSVSITIETEFEEE